MRIVACELCSTQIFLAVFEPLANLHNDASGTKSTEILGTMRHTHIIQWIPTLGADKGDIQGDIYMGRQTVLHSLKTA